MHEVNYNGRTSYKGLNTCYSATYMSQTRFTVSDRSPIFTISEVAADWHM